MRILLALALSSAAFAQSKEPPPVTGMLNFIHAVSNLERSIAFYCDVFGLEKPNPPRPPNPAVPALIGVPGALLRVAVFRIPGASFGLEITDFGGIERHPGQPRHTDPGAADLILRVRDTEPVISALRKTGTTVNANVRSFFVPDPDGYLIEVVQDAPSTDSPATGNILGAAMGITVADLDATRQFYRNLLGFELSAGKDSAEVRQMAGNVPGTKSRIEFYEFKGVSRTPFHGRVPDPGTPAIALRVTDLDVLLQRLKAAKVTVVSTGGVPAQFSPTIRNIFIEDPDGFKIELFQQQTEPRP